jgi:SAM-dependent methyltransferase
MEMNLRKIKNELYNYLPFEIYYHISKLYKVCHATYYKYNNATKNNYNCPICCYYGPFVDIIDNIGISENSQCPKCGSTSKGRLQYLVINELRKKYDFSKMSMLHFAPEFYSRRIFSKLFKVYHTADLYVKNLDFCLDITKINLKDGVYDVVFASHVLEHLRDDEQALSEIRRILKPNGMAILPVPIFSSQTIEYPEPNLFDYGHVRSPGPDYYERYRKYFAEMIIYNSHDFQDSYQTIFHQSPRNLPQNGSIARRSGEHFIETVPVCFKNVL